MPQEIHQRALPPARVRFAVDEQAGTFTGYAAVFNDLVPSYNERVLPGAFTRTLAERAARGDALAILWAHDPREVIGVATSLAEDSYGLRVEGRLILDIDRAREAYTLIREGINSLSIGFWPMKWTRNDQGEVLIDDVELYEFSVVYAGAAPRAKITDVRQLGGSPMPDPIMPANPAPAPAAPDMAAIEARIAEMQTRIDEYEARSQRPGPMADARQAEEQTRAFLADLREGSNTHTRALNAGNAAAGGILVPTVMRNSIIERVVEFSPIRALASTITMDTGTIQLPRLDDEVVVGPDGVPEAQTPEFGGVGGRPKSQPSFDMLNLTAFEMAVRVPITRVLLEDTSVDLTGFLTQHVGKKFGQLESSWFLAGDGMANTPIGVLNDGDVTEHGISYGSLADGIADAVIDLYHSIPSAYASRGAFLGNRATMATVRKLKDENGQYLWQPALSAGNPPTLMGRPFYEAPELGGFGVGEVPLLFGDFSSGFLIGERIAVDVLRDDYTGASGGLVYLHFRRRVGGVVTLGEAISKLVIT